MDRDKELMELIESQYKDMKAGGFIIPEKHVCMSLDQVIGTLSHGSQMTLVDLIPDTSPIRL